MFINKIKGYIFRNSSFDSCHASTVLPLENEVLAAWFGGTEEGAKDVAIWISRRRNNRWNSPVKIADDKNIPNWNPVLFKSQQDIIYLFYKRGHTIKEWQTMVMVSNDNGYTWTEPQELTAGDRGGRGPVRNKPIILEDGTWLAPASLENGEWKSFVDISYDKGQTWVKSKFVPIKRGDNTDNKNIISGKGIIQPTLWESDPGVVHMLLRSTEGVIYRSDSNDSGQTWSEAYSTGIPNNSGIDLTKLKNGNLILAYNPIKKNWGPRTPLILSISKDNGKEWEKIITLENKEGEYSYPAIISKNNDIHLTYTWRRKKIAYWRLTY